MTFGQKPLEVVELDMPCFHRISRISLTKRQRKSMCLDGQHVSPTKGQEIKVFPAGL